MLCATPAIAIRQFDSSDGLLRNSANSIVRDDLGYLWFAADSGLNRFDGQHFTAPPDAIADALKGITITAMASDGHLLWIGTRSAGLRRVDLRLEQVTAFLPEDGGLPPTTIQGIAIDDQHRVWLATDGAGVVSLDMASATPRYRQFLPTTQGLPHVRVWSIAIDVDGTILAGTQTGGARLTPGANAFQRMRLPPPFPDGGETNFEEFIGDGAGGYWIGTWDHGLFHADAAGVRRIPRADAAASSRVTSIALMDGEPMVGFDTGIARYASDCGCLRSIALPSGNDGNSQLVFVRTLLGLDDGGVYVGTWANGAFQVPPNTTVFRSLPALQAVDGGLMTRSVQSVFEDHNGVLWLGGYGSGLQRSIHAVGDAPIAMEHVRIKDNWHTGARVIYVIREDRNGRIWVGSDAGVDRLDPRENLWRHFGADPAAGGLPGDGVRDLLELPSGNFLVATSSGLALIDEADQVRSIRYAEPGPSEAVADTINALALDQHGRIWLATYHGVYVLGADYRVLKSIRRPQLHHDLVRDLKIVDNGKVYIAAGHLCTLDSRPSDLGASNADCEDQQLGLPDDDIQAIEADRDGTIWLSSQHGLRHLVPGAKTVQAYYANDGLLTDEFVQGASFAGTSGRIYFGTAFGLQMFDPRAAISPQQQLRPVLSMIRVGGRTLGAADIGATANLDASPSYAVDLRLPPDQREVVLGFDLIGASRADQRLQFRVDGLQGWVSAADADAGNFLNLPAGDQDVYLRIVENGAPVGIERKILALHVAPFWWERTIVQALAVFAIALVAWMLYRQRILGIRNNERRLMEQVRLRTGEIEQQKSDLALANQKLYELSIRDGLTGVFNRRHSLEEARRTLRTDHERPTCIALIDLDHFKLINDRFGHIAGDEALRAFARLLNSQAGPGDVIGRYGGEEFICLLYDRDIAQSSHWANQLLARLRSEQIAGPNCEIRITASIGLVAIKHDAELPLEIWIARADAALYRAKENGRDQMLLG
ncbi:MAG: diguanylate cyclase [Dokdonella sp.]